MNMTLQNVTIFKKAPPLPVGETEKTMSAVALLGAFAGGLLTYLTALRNIYNSSVIQERKEWRDRIRRLTAELAKSLDEENSVEIRNLRRKLRVRLNPTEAEDIAIIEATKSDELTARVAILLKHDWERSKLETGLISQWLRKAERPKFTPGTRPSQRSFVKAREGVICVLSIALLITLPLIVDLVSPFSAILKKSWQTF